MRPLGIGEGPRPGMRGVLPPALRTITGGKNNAVVRIDSKQNPNAPLR